MRDFPNRRHFLRTATLAGAALPISVSAGEAPASQLPICGFTKHLQGLSATEIARIAAESGLDGIEAPVRPGGHVEPGRVADDLPALVEALRAQKLDLSIMTTAITEVSAAQHTETVLRTAKSLGIRHYRMGYLKYDLKRPIQPQLDAWAPRLRELIVLSRSIGIQPLLQNHSGADYFGGPVWDAWSLMKDYAPGDWGLAMDSCHLTTEAGKCWPVITALTRSHIQAVYFKDLKWTGPGKTENVPLGTGQVPSSMAAALVPPGFTGPVSLHTEYLEGDVKSPAFLTECVTAFRRDLAVLRGWLSPGQ